MCIKAETINDSHIGFQDNWAKPQDFLLNVKLDCLKNSYNLFQNRVEVYDVQWRVKQLGGRGGGRSLCVHVCVCVGGWGVGVGGAL